MSKKATEFQKREMSKMYRGKEIFKPLNTGWVDERVACVREWVANIFFYRKGDTTIMIDAGYNYDRLAEKIGWLGIDPQSIRHILITHQDTDHVGAVEADSPGLFRSAKLYIGEIENRYLTGEVRRKVIYHLYKLPQVTINNEKVLLHDGETFEIDGIKIECFLVPGHTWGHMVYLITDSNLNHTGIYLYSKGKIMIHLTFDYKTDEKCTTPGQYLKYHRTFQGLSTRELAEKVGIVPATLVLYENDRHPIKHSTAVALANALGIDRNRLLDKYTAFVDYPYSSLLKKVRQDLSLTQIQMAELIGIGQTSYSGWEREIRVPRRKEYDKILAALEKLRVNVDTYLCQSASI